MISSSSTQTVLVVDDSLSCLKILQAALEQLDCRMIVAKSGERALELARSQKPSLILLDVVMDDMDGFDTCARLKANPETAQAVVIFLSAVDDMESRLRGLEMGGVDYIAKPFSADEVRAKVATHLEMLALRQTLEMRNKELREASLTQNRLLGMAAHDLRTPLTAVLIAAKTLKRKKKLNEEQVEELLDIVESSSKNMQGLITELLTVSTLQGGEIKIKPTPTCLTRLVEQRLSLHKFEAEKKGIEVDRALQKLPLLLLDAQKLAQVIDNLISNALKYSWPESRILVSTRSVGEQIEISVEDNGVGITKKAQSTVFEAFSKVGSRPTAGESSHGLGLSIVANIVQCHGGKVEVESEEGEGSRFTVLLPMRPALNRLAS